MAYLNQLQVEETRLRSISLFFLHNTFTSSLNTLDGASSGEVVTGELKIEAKTLVFSWIIASFGLSILIGTGSKLNWSRKLEEL